MSVQVRRATADDAKLISAMRRAMFADMGEPRGTVHPDDLEAAYSAWLAPLLADGRYVGLIAEASPGASLVVAGGAGMRVMDWQPSPLSLTPKRGYVGNVYVVPSFRRQGLATRLVSELVDIARTLGLPAVTLHPSVEGKALYEKIGFTTTDEMRIKLV